MIYLLDSNTCIRYMNGRSPKIRAKLLTVKDQEIALCSIVKAEMLAGAAKSQFPEESRLAQERFFKRFVSIPFDDNAAHVYADIRSSLEKQGNVIGANDMLITAIAVAHQLILVTHNVNEFSRVSQLRIEDWEL